jgi:hypothetical protein
MIPIEQLETVDRNYGDQVTNQVERITAELKVLEQLLIAGLVDRRVLTAFREAVNRIRTTSWAVQQWLEGAQGSENGVPAMLIKERMKIAEQLSGQLASDLSSPDAQLSTEEICSLLGAVENLSLQLVRRSGN